jgi:hypothetical protein
MRTRDSALRLLAATFVLVLSACGGGGSSSSGSPAGPTTTPITSTPAPATVDEVASQYRTAETLQTWMLGNLGYYAPASMDDWRYTSPSDVYSGTKKGDCVHHSAFAHYVLDKNGYKTRLIFILRNGQSTHAVCTWTGADGKLYFLENSFGGHFGIYGPYDTMSQVTTLVYGWLVTLDGQKARYDVRDFTDVSYGIDWLTFIRSGQLLYSVPLQ